MSHSKTRVPSFRASWHQVGALAAGVSAFLMAATPVVAAPLQTERAVSLQEDDFSDGKYPNRLVAGRAIVKFRTLRVDQLQTQAGKAALKEIESRANVDLELVRPLVLGWGLFNIIDKSAAAATSKKMTEAQTLLAIDRVSADPTVEHAQEDRWFRPLLAPNDDLYGNMWHFDMLGMEAAWDVTVGETSQRVGVVDTGLLRNHPDLSPKDANGFDFISSGNQAADGDGRDSNYTDAGDAADCGEGFQNSSWHGSHVSGTIAAAANDSTGVPGMNWNAGIVTARALGRCGGNLSDIMEGAAWMAGLNVNGVPNIGTDKVSVMNLSLGGPGGCSNFEQNIIDAIQAQNVIFVAAAGNDGGAVGSPANCNGVVSVGALGPDGNLTNYSSFGNQIEVVAPGGNFAFGGGGGVLSASNDNGGWTFQQGTSMASPHVAGAISLMQVFDPNLDRLSVTALFVEHGVPCGGCGDKPALRLAPILEAISVGTPTPEPTPEAEPEDAFEDNNDYNSSASLSCGDNVDATITTGDVDYFNLGAVAAGTQVTVAIDGGAQDLDLYVVTGPTQNDVAGQSTTETGVESVTVTAPGTRLDIVVQPWETAAGPYSLSVSCEGGTPSPEPTPETPTPETPTPDTPAPDTPSPEAANPDTPSPDSPSPEGGPEVGVEPEAGTPETPEPGSTIVDPNDPLDDGYEPNNSFAEAATLECGASLSLIAESGGEDWYEFTPGVGIDVRVIARANSGAPLTVMAASGPSVDDVINASDEGPGEIFFSAPTDRVAIRIASANELVSPRYALDIACGANAAVSPNQIDTERPTLADGCSQTQPTTPLLAMVTLLGLALLRRRRRHVAA